jgi:hypothetical protein
MKSAIAVLVAATIVIPLSARAEKIDLTTMRCQQFAQASKETTLVITSWLAGYYSEAGDPEIIDLARVKDIGDRLLTFCAANPNFVVAAAAEGLLGK